MVVGIVSAKLVSYFKRRFIFRLSSFQILETAAHEFVSLFIFPGSRLFLLVPGFISYLYGRGKEWL